MKTNIFRISLIISLIIIVLSGCNQKSPNRQSKDTNAASIDTAAFRNRINELIRQSPKGIATYAFLKENGVSYINGLTLPLSDADRYETELEISMALGAYGVDMNFATICRRLDLAAQTGEVIRRLMAKLGIQNNMPVTFKTLEEVSRYADNKDSAEVYVAKAMTFYHQEQSANSPEVYPLIFIAGNVETFYILTQLTLYSGNNPAMMERLSGQGELARTLLNLLEILSVDETIKPFYEKMKPIVAYFSDHAVFTEKEIKEIAPLIEAIRKDMLL